MKNLVRILCVVTNLISSGAFADTVLSVRQISKDQVAITVLTRYHCNDPKTELIPLDSGRSVTGPYPYELKLTPTNRVGCLDEEEIEVVGFIRPDHRNRDHIVIKSGLSKASFTFKEYKNE